MSVLSSCHGHLRWLTVWILISPLLVPLTAAEPLGVKVPPEFQVELYADDQLAHDIYSMTIDAQGRVVVSGQGYVRILIDKDQDGKAESYEQLVDGPATGAQGMYFHGTDLFCSGDGGLIRYTDRDRNDRADGPPETFLKIKTGSEHNAHAIRRGPDGWWYIIAGNTAEVTSGYVTLPTSPVIRPEHGCILRLKPDLSGGEVFAHGFRNAYDYDFGVLGDLFSFDSDDERDVSLPWYRPTRVFHVLSGSHQGWVSKGWKRPNHFLDMPPVVGDFGRGSPTGVVCYRHNHFPEKFQGALFIQDWTFGRIWAVPLERKGTTWKGDPIEFMTAEGDFGFAPTDIEVGSDGSMYVSIGGRGTRGSVFRITHKARKPAPVAPIPADPEAQLTWCLEHLDPLSSWARQRWQPVAKSLGADRFITAVLEETRPLAARIRGIEILTDLFSGIPVQHVLALLSASEPEIRARTVWAMQTHEPRGLTNELLAKLSSDPDPLVRMQLFDLLTRHPNLNGTEVPAQVYANGLGSDSRFVGQAAARALRGVPQELMNQIGLIVRKSSWQTAILFAFAQYGRQQFQQPGINAYAIEMGRRVLENRLPPEVKLEGVRLIQLGLGDLGLYGNLPAVTRGYVSPFDLNNLERDLDPVRVTISQTFPTGERWLDYELARTGAMLGMVSPPFLDAVLKKITPETSPTDDIHYLVIAGRLPVTRNAKLRAAIASGLVAIDEKVSKLKLPLDTNWSDRVTEMYNQLVEQDAELPSELLRQPGFGRPGHVLLLGKTPPDQFPAALSRFREKIQKDPEYPWTNDVVFLFGEVDTPENRKMLRELCTQPAVKSAAVICLAKRPEEVDRPRFVESLDSSQLEVLTASLTGLEKLGPSQEPAENIALVRTLRRLGGAKPEFPLRDRVVQLLQRNSGQEFEYEFGTEGEKPQPAAAKAWTDWALTTYPQQAPAGLLGGSAEDLKEVQRLLAATPWDQGDPERGRKLFETRSCLQCHAGSRALGPDLAGVTSRFSREDLLTAIILPNRDVSPQYQTTMIETKQGKVYSGLIIYESVDGVMLRNSTNQTYRFEADEIESRQKLNSSLMPTGLLKDLPPEDVASLWAYLGTLVSNRNAVQTGGEEQN